jgi:hypothetical protein
MFRFGCHGLNPESANMKFLGAKLGKRELAKSMSRQQVRSFPKKGSCKIGDTGLGSGFSRLIHARVEHSGCAHDGMSAFIAD